jgi:hypothetical protein
MNEHENPAEYRKHLGITREREAELDSLVQDRIRKSTVIVGDLVHFARMCQADEISTNELTYTVFMYSVSVQIFKQIQESQI